MGLEVKNLKTFINEDFLLHNEYSKKLYHSYAEKMPIIDYHCHIEAADIADDIAFNNITELWLGGDHYKWRYMRSCGIDERYITGNASAYEKFEAWISALERAVGNPLYHWSHLELLRYFDYDKVLTSADVKETWDYLNKKLEEGNMTARSFVKNSMVDVICTTDDPLSDLKAHKALSADAGFETKVYPAWRPDPVLMVNEDFYPYIEKLSALTETKINSIDDLKVALAKRMDYFDQCGCRLSDHGLTYIPYVCCSEDDISKIWDKIAAHNPLTDEEMEQYATYMMLFFGSEYCKRDWAMQLHYGCSRNNNTKMYKLIGANTGYDCIAEDGGAGNLIKYLDALCEKDCLPRTILYSLNPQDNAMIDTIVGCFQDSSAISKIQHGCAWWFNDHKEGINDMLKTLSMTGNLSAFIGMLTDSRSFLSYTRHEYFRRILCEYIGKMVDDSEFPADYDLLGRIISDISYNNAKKYFGF